LYLISDLTADFLAAGGRKQQGSANTNAYSSRKGEHITNRVIFACIKVLSPVTQVRHSVGGTLDAIGDPVAHVAGKAVSLVQKVDGSLQNRSNQIVHQNPPFVVIATSLFKLVAENDANGLHEIKPDPI
jgi:hypothetical protein